jgi:hypothetical protein
VSYFTFAIQLSLLTFTDIPLILSGRSPALGHKPTGLPPGNLLGGAPTSMSSLSGHMAEAGGP